ncbi:hypothetical protein KAR91_60320 [Candidatus Pacearchaeota archaeon]|nr:hypothetical protein [Candidatus Pacearchaeota archaeon]
MTKKNSGRMIMTRELTADPLERKKLRKLINKLERKYEVAGNVEQKRILKKTTVVMARLELFS